MGPKRRRDPDTPDSHIGILDEVEGTNKGRRKSRPAVDDDGLDIDDIW